MNTNIATPVFAWAESAWRADATVPSYLRISRLTSSRRSPWGRRKRQGHLDEIALDEPVALSGSARSVRHAWAVRARRRRGRSRRTGQRDVHLLAYRDAEHTVRWLELTPLAASIVEGSSRSARSASRSPTHAPLMVRPPAAVAPDVARLLAGPGRAWRGARRSTSVAAARRSPSRRSRECARPRRSASRAARSRRARGRSGPAPCARGPARARRARDRARRRRGVSMIMAPARSGRPASAESASSTANPLVARDVDLHDPVERRRRAATLPGSMPKFWQFT